MVVIQRSSPVLCFHKNRFAAMSNGGRAKVKKVLLLTLLFLFFYSFLALAESVGDNPGKPNPPGFASFRTEVTILKQAVDGLFILRDEAKSGPDWSKLQSRMASLLGRLDSLEARVTRAEPRDADILLLELQEVRDRVQILKDTLPTVAHTVKDNPRKQDASGSASFRAEITRLKQGLDGLFFLREEAKSDPDWSMLQSRIASLLGRLDSLQARVTVAQTKDSETLLMELQKLRDRAQVFKATAAQEQVGSANDGSLFSGPPHQPNPGFRIPDSSSRIPHPESRIPNQRISPKAAGYPVRDWQTPDRKGWNDQRPLGKWAGVANSTVVLLQTGSISGTVTNTSLTPLQDVEVQVFDSSGNYATSASTLIDGTYTAGGLSTGTYYAGVRQICG